MSFSILVWHEHQTADPFRLCAQRWSIPNGCRGSCPIFPGQRYEDWALDDPAGQDLEMVRRIRNEINGRVRLLIGELLDQGETG